MNKYRNTKTEVDHILFDSKAEGRRYGELALLEAAGEILGLKVHPRFELCEGVVLDGRKRPPLRFTADFCYFDTATKELIVEDVKSPASRTTAYKMRRHLYKAKTGIEVREVE